MDFKDFNNWDALTEKFHEEYPNATCAQYDQKQHKIVPCPDPIEPNLVEDTFIKAPNPGQLFVQEVDSTDIDFHYNPNKKFILYLKGDGTKEGGTLRLKHFSAKAEAEEFKTKFSSDPRLEKIKTKLFNHASEGNKIYINLNDYITGKYYEILYPELRKYQNKAVELPDVELTEYIKTLVL